MQIFKQQTVTASSQHSPHIGGDAYRTGTASRLPPKI